MFHDYDNDPRSFFDVPGRDRSLAREGDGPLAVYQPDFVESVMSSDLSIRCVEGEDGEPEPFLVADDSFEETVLDYDGPEEWPVVLDYLPAVLHFDLDKRAFWQVERDDVARRLLERFGWCVLEDIGEHTYTLLYATIGEDDAVMMSEEMCAGFVVVLPIQRRKLRVV